MKARGWGARCEVPVLLVPVAWETPVKQVAHAPKNSKRASARASAMRPDCKNWWYTVGY
jgi:hypothetical protein